MIPFRLYVVCEAPFATAEKILAIAREGGERVAFYLRGGSVALLPEIGLANLHGARVFLPRAASGLDFGCHLKAVEIVHAPDEKRRAILVGASAHSEDEARAAREAGCDFAVFGHVWETPSKRGLAPRGLDALAAACRAAAPLPVLAIGGVTPERVPDCLAAGAFGVAAIRAVLDAGDPRQAARAYLRALG